MVNPCNVVTSLFLFLKIIFYLPFCVEACDQNPTFLNAVDIWTCLQVLFGGNNWLVNCK